MVVVGLGLIDQLRIFALIDLIVEWIRFRSSESITNM